MTGATPRERFAQIVRTEPVDLGLATLLLATEACPQSADHDVAEGLRTLQALAFTLPSKGRAADRLRSSLANFQGDDREYSLLRSSLLPHVLRRLRGLPIMLSVVWLEVARRAEIPAYGIGLAGHFIVGIGDPDGFHELVDPWHRGRPLRASDLRRLT